MLVAIIAVYDIKISGTKLNEVAKILGPGKPARNPHRDTHLLTDNRTDCTAKACTHRLAKLRSMAQGEMGPAGNGTPGSTPMKSKMSKPSTPANKKAKIEKKDSVSRSSTPDMDAEETPVIERPKRSTPKRDYAQMNSGGSDGDDSADGEDWAGDGATKQLKTEAGED